MHQNISVILRLRYTPLRMTERKERSEFKHFNPELPPPRMPTGTVTEEILASSAEVFALLHDYARRLDWDTLLSAARLEDGATQAGLGVESTCVGKPSLGGLALRTRYVAFRPPELAAVEMVNRPPFFASFAASIRHQDTGPASSLVTYRFTFQARPRFLRSLLHPVMAAIFRAETRKRLAALQRYFVVDPSVGS